MRRSLAVLLLVLAACSFAIAGSGRCAPKKTRVLASTFPVYQIVRNVAEGYAGVEVELMIPAALGCPHDYALTPGDLRKISGADVLVVNGLGLEEFLGAPVARAKPGVKIIDASKDIDGVLKEEDGHGEFNPHVFASPRLSGAMAVNIARGLAELDPQGGRTFNDNASRYDERMRKLAARAAETGKRLVNRRIVTGHDAFDYLAADAGLQVVAVVQSHAGLEPSAAEMRAIAANIREEKAGGVFYEPQYSAKVAQTVAREAGVPSAMLDPGASGPENAPLDYFDKVLEKNLQTLEKTIGVR